MTSRHEGDSKPLLVNSDTEGEGGHGGYGSDEDHLVPPKKTTSSKSTKTPCFVYMLTFLSAIGGFLFGYDTGVVSGAMLLLKDVFHLDYLWQELVVSATIAAAAVFAVVGGYTNDRFGRKPTLLAASCVFTAGALLLGLAQNTGLLLAGRIVVGMGVGLASSTVPMYIAEAAPVHLRGRLVILNNIFITGGQFIASVIAGLFSFDRQNGWRYMLGLAGVPSLVMFIGFLFMPESPRWLVSREKDSEARAVLCKIRGTMDVDEELETIKEFHNEERLLTQSSQGSGPVLCRIFRTRHVLKALVVGCGLQMFQQISGINTVMYYSATIINMSGVKNSSIAIWLAAVTSGVNFVFTFVGMYLVERIGRRPLTISSLVGTFISLCLLAIGFQLAAFSSPPINHNATLSLTNSSCSQYSVCDGCMTDSSCGFCYNETIVSSSGGVCLPAFSNQTAAVIPCGPVEADSGWTWAFDYCPTPYSWMAFAGLILYLAFFAPGMGPMPWTINSEIYPLWARSTGNSTATAVNWVFNLLISVTFLSLTQALTRYGAFWLYSGFAFAGMLFVVALLPETRGKSLEEVEQLFKKPWSLVPSSASSHD